MESSQAIRVDLSSQISTPGEFYRPSPVSPLIVYRDYQSRQTEAYTLSVLRNHVVLGGGVVFTNEVVLGAWREFWTGLPPLSGTNTRVSEEELMVINIDSSEQSRARLQL